MAKFAHQCRQRWQLFLFIIPSVAFILVFCYYPMAGVQIAFRNYTPRGGIWGSEWVGLKYFVKFFRSYQFKRVLSNTLIISFYSMAVNFPLSILMALIINVVRRERFKKLVQTISYMPHFISLVVVCSMITLFVDKDGFIVQLINLFNGNISQNLLNIPSAFVPIYILSDIWQETGWNCIIYLAALGAIDMELYEAARIDGANRWQQTIHVTIPGITRTIMLLLILRVGSIMSVGHEKIILLYNDYTMETADVISSYVYRRGLINAEYSFSTAVGLFNSVINFALVVLANFISNKTSGYGIW